MNPQLTRLNLIPNSIKPVINVNQYDKQNDALIFEIYDGSVPYEIPSNYAILINGTKPDKTGFSYSARKSGTSRVTANLTSQMTVLEGEVECEIRFQTQGATLIHGTLNFILRVERAALNEDTVISETEIPLIERAVEIASNIEQYAAEVEANATRAEDAAEDAEYQANLAQAANEQVNAKAATIDNAVINANTAAQNATDIYNTVSAAYQSGAFKGDKGDKGDTGESGVYTPIDGFFSMSVDENGDLYVNSTTDMSDSWEYDSTTGNLYYLTDDGT